MSSKSWLIDTKNSMLIVDEAAFPVNLGTTVKEDAPEGSFRIIPFAGNNVLPTALGYRAFFSDSSILDIPPVPSNYCQHILYFQTPTFITIAIALCEEGIYVCNVSNTGTHVWEQVVATGFNPASQVRHLATFAVVANKLCIYIQGMPRYYVVADIATIDNLVARAPVIAGADVDKVYNSATYSYAVASVLPTFINMAGQMGLFRADNRLGFWDSDNAVAWSSATQLFDFTPSTETFAGITTFADVQGQIVKVMGHGDGFVIYASRSITLVSPVIGSPERFAGQGILSETGVSYDTQIAVAQPDTIHYALTSAGLVRIASGNPEFVHTEVSDYVVENSQVVALNMLDGRYLFMTTTDDLKPAKVEVDTVQVVDHENDGYFMLPTEEYSPGDPPIPVVHWDFDGNDPIAWNNPTYRDNTGAWSDFRWIEDGDRLKLRSLSLGWTVYELRTSNIMSVPRYPVPSPTVPNLMQWTANLYISMGAGESAELTYYIDGVRTVRTFTQSDGVVNLVLTSPVFTKTSIGAQPEPNNSTEFGVNRLLNIDNIVYVDNASIIALDNIHLDIPGASDASQPTETLEYMIQGKSSLVQDGFANFSVSDQDQATFVQAREVPLVPCYSGGDFKSSWSDGVERVIGEDPSVFLSFPNGVSLFVKMQVVRFQTPYTKTKLGPIYTDPRGYSKVRIVDEAGDEILATFADAADRLNAQLLTTANDILIDIPSNIIDEEMHAATATPLSPYPLASSVPDIILNKDNTGQEILVENMMVPASGAMDLTECAVNLKSLIQDVKFTSYITGYISLRSMYALMWEATYAIDAQLVNAAVVVVGPYSAFNGGNGGNWVGYATNFRTGGASYINFEGTLNAAALADIFINPDTRLLTGAGSIPPSPTQIAAMPSEWASMNNGKTWGYTEPDGIFGVIDAGLYGSPIAAALNQRAKIGLSYEPYDLTDFTWPARAGSWVLENVDYVGDRVEPNLGAVDSASSAIQYISTYYAPRVGRYEYKYDPDADPLVVATYRNTENDSTYAISVRDQYLVVYNADLGVTMVSPAAPGSLPAGLESVWAAIPPRPFIASNMAPDNIVIPNLMDYAAEVSVQARDWVLDQYTQQVDWEWVGTSSELDHFAIEVSGYGYFPGIGEGFRKTHNRNSSTSCPLPTDPSVTLPADIGDDVRGSFSPNYPNYSGQGTKPANPWPFPDPVPFPDTYALFRVGSWAPFYPTYKAAVFWDTQLNKWGRFNNEHKLVTTMMAVNREDAGIVPTVDLGLRGNSLREDGRLTVWSGDNKRGSIRYGRIGNYRLGWTTVTKVIIRFASPAVCNVLIEPSLDGASVDSVLTVGVTVDGLNQVEIPFTARVKWFNILIEGDFNLVGIQYESEARGRR